MNNHYRVYKIEPEEDGSSNRVKLEWTRGCNGKKHVDNLERVFYDAGGEVEYAEELTIVEQGPCDNTCGTERRGGFLYPSSTKAPSSSN